MPKNNLNDDKFNHEIESDIQDNTPVKRFSILKALFYVLPTALILGFGGYFILSQDTQQIALIDEDSLIAINTGAPAKEEKPVIKDGESIFIEMNPLTVNLRRGTTRQQRYLKLAVRFEVKSYDDQELLEKIMPRIRDQFQVFLRELRVEDLEGSTGAYRIREELLHRVNIVARPAVITDILFDELLVQ